MRIYIYFVRIDPKFLWIIK